MSPIKHHFEPSPTLTFRVAILAFTLPVLAEAASTPELWYQQPAGKWTEALPIGNANATISSTKGGVAKINNNKLQTITLPPLGKQTINP